MDLIEYKGTQYPKFQTTGYASQFAIPFAKYFCMGKGFDIGCNRIEWAFPGSIPIDLNFNDRYDAYNLPEDSVDYIYSSHCLEHLPDWVEAMDYWKTKLNVGGILFLYLPHYDQTYWRPWNNFKHKHIFSPQIIEDYLLDRGYINIFKSEKDLNNSFIIVAEKCHD